MCGIVGILNFNSQPVDKAVLAAMEAAMVHRGPDDGGLYLSESGVLGLAHRRLSIIDLSDAGRQPMANEDKTIWLTFNGEIYNHQKYRKYLENKGHIFQSNTDTEIIIHLYEEIGIDVVNEIDGMFAFGLWDEKRKQLFLARDRFGKKPLYYTFFNGNFLFASEIKALLKYPLLPVKIDEMTLSLYLTFASSPAPRTMFQNIKKLPNANRMTVSLSGNINITNYYDIAKKVVNIDHEITIDNAISRLKDLLLKSVDKRMMSDVPVGVFLSGGVDSSANVALMSQVSNKTIETFTVNKYNDQISNESKYINQIVDAFKTNHHEIVINDNDYLSLFDDLAYIQDEPLADPVCVPLYYLAQLARNNGVKVIQLGEGSDEIFLGYNKYYTQNIFWQKIMHYYSRLSPTIFKKLIVGLISLYDREKLYTDLATRAWLKKEHFTLGIATAFGDCQKAVMLKKDVLEKLNNDSLYLGIDYVDNAWSDFCQVSKSSNRILFWTYQELTHRLPELLLMRLDKMLMAHGIEGRAPYLDTELVEFSLRLPTEFKFKNGNGKLIFKKSIEHLLPKEIITRQKMGFCGSAGNILSGKIKEFAYNLLVERKILDEWINTDEIKYLFAQHTLGQEGRSFRIWNLLNLGLWVRTWLA